MNMQDFQMAAQAIAIELAEHHRLLWLGIWGWGNLGGASPEEPGFLGGIPRAPALWGPAFTFFGSFACHHVRLSFALALGSFAAFGMFKILVAIRVCF